MLRRFSLILILPVLFCLFSSALSIKTDRGIIEPLIKELIQTNKQTSGLSLDMIMKERIGESYLTKKASFKVLYSPLSIYLKQHQPHVFEVLYIEGQNSNKAWVRPQSFPWTTLSLSPVGKTMRDNSHHSIFKSGFRFFIDILSHLQTKYGERFYDMISYNGRVKYNNVLCHKITLENPNFRYVPYKVEKETGLEELSNRLKINDYMVVEKNPLLKNFASIPSGTTLTVPNDYGKTIIVYIEVETGLLAGVKVSDDKGLWEEYTYTNIILNPKFTSIDFDKNNPAYSF